MKCCICQSTYEGYGNNPAPLKEEGRCCDFCNWTLVVPYRLVMLEDRLEKSGIATKVGDSGESTSQN